MMKARTTLIGASAAGVLLGSIYHATGRPTWAVVTVYALAAVTAIGAAFAPADKGAKER